MRNDISEQAKQLLQLAEAYAQAANSPRRSSAWMALEKAVVEMDKWRDRANGEADGYGELLRACGTFNQKEALAVIAKGRAKL